MKKNSILFLAFLVLCTSIGTVLFVRNHKKTVVVETHPTESPQSVLLLPTPVVIATIPSPVPAPVVSPSTAPQLTLAQSTQAFGPCAVVPTLMYHHVEDLGLAQIEGHKQLTVGTEYFRAQMQYLKDHHYSVIRMQNLIHFFNDATPLPSKPILLTFDDAYSDFKSDAYPILQSFNFPGTVFTPTGLLENPGYLTWQNLKEMSASGLILFSNHTWSHHNVAVTKPVVEKEISLAETQLRDRGYDNPKVFAYPYGSVGPYAETYLDSHGYQIAFTTVHGATQCKKKRLELPRFRIGNAQLNFYGL